MKVDQQGNLYASGLGGCGFSLPQASTWAPSLGRSIGTTSRGVKQIAKLSISAREPGSMDLR